MSIFDANCPEFFAPNERAQYESFLSSMAGEYEVCVRDAVMVGAFGLIPQEPGRASLNWIMIDPAFQRAGIGSIIMGRVIEKARVTDVHVISIAASHRSAPYFAKSGAAVLQHIVDGWGPGMHRVEMELRL